MIELSYATFLINHEIMGYVIAFFLCVLTGADVKMDFPVGVVQGGWDNSP